MLRHKGQMSRHYKALCSVKDDTDNVGLLAGSLRKHPQGSFLFLPSQQHILAFRVLFSTFLSYLVEKLLSIMNESENPPWFYMRFSVGTSKVPDLVSLSKLFNNSGLVFISLD